MTTRSLATLPTTRRAPLLSLSSAAVAGVVVIVTVVVAVVIAAAAVTAYRGPWPTSVPSPTPAGY